MTEIPPFWLWVSGAFFLLGALFFLTLIIAMVLLVIKVNQLAPQVQETIKKVNGLTAQVQDISQKVGQIATNLNSTVTEVGGRAKGVVGSVELVTQSASRQFERFSPFVVGAVTAIRLVRSLAEMRKKEDTKLVRRGRKKKNPLTLFRR